jgi:hypothetical protein
LLSSLTQNLPGGVYRFYARDGGREMGLYYISDKAKGFIRHRLGHEQLFRRIRRPCAPEDRESFTQSILMASSVARPGNTKDDSSTMTVR